MKKLFLVLGILVVTASVILLIGVRTWVEIRQKQQQAIIAVVNEAAKYGTQRRTLKNGRVIMVRPGNPLFSVKEYANRLNEISTVNCPEPFQLAWLNLTQTMQRTSMPFAGLGSALELTVSLVKPNGAGAKDALRRLDRINPQIAWEQVQVVALKYGVQIH